MNHIQNNISLKPFNTFGIDVTAKHFVSVSDITDLRDVLSLEGYPNKLILGGGSNMLLTKNQDKFFLHIKNRSLSDLTIKAVLFFLIK